MTIEESFNKIKEALGIKSAEVDNIATELTAARTSLTEKEAIVAELTKSADLHKVELAKAAARISEMENTVSEATKKYAALEQSFETAAKKAAKIAASVGVEPVECAPVADETASKTNDEIAQEWAAIKQKDAKAAQVFYNTNRSAILAAANLR
jgi:predicted  nucleic acid-binding Zn-ribbon protein